MAAATPIYLQGGPCDGKTTDANAIVGGLTAYIPCGGGYYIDSGNTRPDGTPIWKYYGKSAPQPPGGATSARAHGGWHDVRVSVNKHMPAALRSSHHNTQAALRSLSRARKVRL